MPKLPSPTCQTLALNANIKLERLAQQYKIKSIKVVKQAYYNFSVEFRLKKGALYSMSYIDKQGFYKKLQVDLPPTLWMSVAKDLNEEVEPDWPAPCISYMQGCQSRAYEIGTYTCKPERFGTAGDTDILKIAAVGECLELYEAIIKALNAEVQVTTLKIK